MGVCFVAINLFRHNAAAYASVTATLAETGKAAVIHPTGTGKSFIGFKLCEDNPNKTICWLSPSEYIFKTQLENLTAAGGASPDNIKFYTYAKLMLLSDEEITAIEPDFIVSDEFHRCGSLHWGNGVKRLLSAGIYQRKRLQTRSMGRRTAGELSEKTISVRCKDTKAGVYRNVLAFG